MPAPSRRPITPAGTGGKAQGGLPLGNPVCLWQTELFKLNLKSSPSSSGYNRRRRLATRSSGKQQAERTAVRTAPIVCPEESPLVRPQAHTPCPRRGMTRRLRRGRWGCRPEGGSTFFRSERKYQRKHAARRLREKGFYCPFCRRGSQCRAQWSWTVFTFSWSALVLAFFRRQNGRAFFPPLPIAALLPRSRRRTGLPLAGWDASL